MASIQKTLNDDLLYYYVNNQDDIDTLLAPVKVDATLHFNRKDAGLNVLTKWNLGLNDARAKVYSEAVIKCINDSFNGFVVISDMFTLINGQAPSNVLAYEQQIALAVKILKSINKPVLLWPGAVERKIAKVSSNDLDLMYKAYSYVRQEKKNIYLLEKLFQTKDYTKSSFVFDVTFQSDIVKDPYVRIEIKDKISRSRTVKWSESSFSKNEHQSTADIVIDLSTQQNAKIYPNILCFAPMCSMDLLNRDAIIPQIMNDSYYKLVVEKNDTPRGYTVVPLQKNYYFDRFQEAHADRINITANTIMEKMKDAEQAVIDEIFTYFMKKQAEVESERIDVIHEVLDRNKQSFKQQESIKAKSDEIDKNL